MASTPDGSDPDLALSLYVAIGRIVRTMRQDAPNARVGPGGLGVLVALDQAGPLRVGALADAVAVTAPSMTRIINVLETEGLVVREADPTDGRAQVVAMTAAGRALVGSGREVRLATLRRRLQQLPADERERLELALGALELLGGAHLRGP